MLADPSLGGKWLQNLKEIAPKVLRVAVLYNPVSQPFVSQYRQSIDDAAHAFGLETISAQVHDAGDIKQVFASLAGQANTGLIVLPDAFTVVNRGIIIEASVRDHVDTIYPFRLFAADGGLLSYGVVQAELFRQAATYVDRILRGAKPADLPVQSPKKFELVINVKTAKMLGLTISPNLLALSDEVIE